MTNLKIYVILLFGMSAMLYLFGYTSPFIALLSNVGVTESGSASTTFVSSLLNSLSSMFLNPTFLGLLGFSAIAAYLTGGGGSGSSIYYLVPIFMLLLMLNFFVLPTEFINAASFNPVIGLLVLGFMNVLLTLSILEFVRGS